MMYWTLTLTLILHGDGGIHGARIHLVKRLCAVGVTLIDSIRQHRQLALPRGLHRLGRSEPLQLVSATTISHQQMRPVVHKQGLGRRGETHQGQNLHVRLFGGHHSEGRLSRQRRRHSLRRYDVLLYVAHEGLSYIKASSQWKRTYNILNVYMYVCMYVYTLLTTKIKNNIFIFIIELVLIVVSSILFHCHLLKCTLCVSKYVRTVCIL